MNDEQEAGGASDGLRKPRKTTGDIYQNDLQNINVKKRNNDFNKK